MWEVNLVNLYSDDVMINGLWGWGQRSCLLRVRILLKSTIFLLEKNGNKQKEAGDGHLKTKQKCQQRHWSRVKMIKYSS